MATKIIDVTYRFCGQWQDTHEAHLIYHGTTPTDLCPGTEGSGASMVSELVTALKALVEEVDRDQRSDGWSTPAREDARALLVRLKAP